MSLIWKECLSLGNNMGNFTGLAGLGFNNSDFRQYLADKMEDPQKMTIRNISGANPPGFTDNYGFGDYLELVTMGPDNDTLSTVGQGSK